MASTGVRAYNGGLGAVPPVGSRGKAPGGTSADRGIIYRNALSDQTVPFPTRYLYTPRPLSQIGGSQPAPKTPLKIAAKLLRYFTECWDTRVCAYEQTTPWTDGGTTLNLQAGELVLRLLKLTGISGGINLGGPGLRPPLQALSLRQSSFLPFSLRSPAAKHFDAIYTVKQPYKIRVDV